MTESVKTGSTRPGSVHSPALKNNIMVAVLRCMLWALILGLVVGCAQDPKLDKESIDLVFRPRPMPTEEGSATEQAARVTVLIQRLDFPVQADLTKAQQGLSLAGLSEKEIEHWREQGLTAGTLTIQEVQGWMLRLPAWVDGRQMQLMIGEEQVPVSISAPLDRQGVKLPAPGEPVEQKVDGEPGAAVKWLALAGGRVQFLLRVRRVTEERFLVEVVPHHNQPRVSFEPRLRMERELDGPSFTALRLLGTVTQGDVLVVMPGKVNETSKAAGEVDTQVESEVNQVNADESATEPTMMNWGQALLGRERRGERLQAVLLIRVVAMTRESAEER